MTDPYSTPNAVLSNGEQGFEYVGFWARLLASIIDSLLVMIAVYPILISYYGTGYLFRFSLVAGPVDFFVSWVAPAVVVILFWIYRAATPGKMLIGAKIVDAQTGQRPNTKQLLIRYVGYYLSTFALCLGFLWIAWDPQKQGWHDKLAGTVVVRARGANERK